MLFYAIDNDFQFDLDDGAPQIAGVEKKVEKRQENDNSSPVSLIAV